MKKMIQSTLLLIAAVLMLTLCGCGGTDLNGSMGSSEGYSAESTEAAAQGNDTVAYTFRYDDLLQQHYEKHGIDMGFGSPEEYQQAASDVVNNPDALHKTESEDGDDVYYLEDTNEFVVVSTDGYIRTYFCPDAGKAYFDRQ